MCLETGLPFPRASTGYGNELNKISWVSEITNAKSCTWSRLIPAIRTHRGPPSWEAALLGKDPGLLMDSQLDTSHWHHWRLRAFWSKKRQQQTGASPAGASTAVRCWRLCPVRSGQGRGGLFSPEMKVLQGGLHSSLPVPGEMTEKTVVINWKKRASNW